jgi:hypothetical protein
MYMLHKAYPALNLSRHLAHLTGTQKKPEEEPQTSPRMMEHTHTHTQQIEETVAIPFTLATGLPPVAQK